MTAGSGETPKPVIDYGTYALDQVPDWSDPAERLIDVDCAPEELLPLFDTPEIAVSYYGKSLARRHGLAQCGRRCVACHIEAIEYAVEIGWRMTLTPPAPVNPFEFRLALPDASAQFITFHPKCRECYRTWRQNVRIRVMTTMGASLVVGLVILMAALGNAIRHTWQLRDLGRELVRFGAVTILPLLVLGVLTALALDQFVWRRLPGSLRRKVHRRARHTGHLRLVQRTNA